MENASKALLMAGSALIALIVISALALVFNSLSDYRNLDELTEEERQVIDFNSQYQTYDRTNVRGSELYSLLNRVIDYNRRKSSSGTGKDSGQYIGYKPMTIKFSIKNSELENFYATTDTSIIRTNEHLISKTEYEASNTVNTFEKSIKNKVSELEEKYDAISITNLTKALTRIFIEDDSSENDKQTAIINFNNISKKVKVTKWDEIKEKSQIRKDVYLYYEYVQFKRARFDSVQEKLIYDNGTGRIVEMYFEFNGKFE